MGHCICLVLQGRIKVIPNSHLQLKTKIILNRRNNPWITFNPGIPLIGMQRTKPQRFYERNKLVRNTFFVCLSFARVSAVGRFEENTRPTRDWSTLSLSVEFCVISPLSSEATPTAIFLAIAKPEVGGEGGDKGGESQFSSVPESSSPTKTNFSHVQ